MCNDWLTFIVLNFPPSSSPHRATFDSETFFRPSFFCLCHFFAFAFSLLSGSLFTPFRHTEPVSRRGELKNRFLSNILQALPEAPKNTTMSSYNLQSFPAINFPFDAFFFGFVFSLATHEREEEEVKSFRFRWMRVRNPKS